MRGIKRAPSEHEATNSPKLTAKNMKASSQPYLLEDRICRPTLKVKGLELGTEGVS